MTKPRAILVGLLSLTVASPAARAERLVSAFDPRLHVRPPTMRALDGTGTSTELVLDEDFLQQAERHGARNARTLAAPGEVGTLGEVIIIQGDVRDDLNPRGILVSNGSGWGLARDALVQLARKVIDFKGDHFQAITVWLTFDDKASTAAEAYESPVKNEVEGLGRLPVMDNSNVYGSQGVLRSILNMKTVGLRAGDTLDSWRPHLETWGQESAHRWMVFMSVRDPRTDRPSDLLLGRQCSHYGRYVDTQASVHDGYAWTDNGDGTFSWTESSKRYGNLDLYGMGLMAADEVPPFFLIDNVPGYTYPTSCQSYQFSFRHPPQTIRGERVDLTIDDIIVANGERKVPTDERQDYWREALVILTAPTENAETARVQMLAARLEKGRQYWEEWNREASRNRLVMCTQVSEDCGDPRSDAPEILDQGQPQHDGDGPQFA